jgi:hypothetical protein
MQWYRRLPLLGITLIVGCGSQEPTSSSTQWNLQRPVVVSPQHPIKLPPSDLRPDCPNPAVRLAASIANRTSDFTGIIHIDVDLHNWGRQSFRSHPKQQSLQIYENERLLLNRPFNRLEPGETLTVTVPRTWNTSIEFPPSYRAMIQYDPDIVIDGNPANDDCRLRDNQRTITGESINRLFRQAAAP